MSQDTKTALRHFSYYKTGGGCRYFFAPTSEEELQRDLALIARDGLSLFILGGGTNSLVMDEFWDGAVLSLHALKRFERVQNRITVLAGVDNSDFATYAKETGLKGAEWMYGLPGQIGGSVRMNARCYGGEMSHIVSEVVCFTPQGERREYQQTELAENVFFGYKDTVFMHEELIIARVSFDLEAGEPSAIETAMQRCLEDRQQKGQFLFPSCGCVFKNDYSEDVSVPSGMLLERAGVLGRRWKNAVVSSKHANFVFNQGASSRDIIELTLQMRERVWEEFGVWLQYEMEFLGDMPKDLEAQVQKERLPKYQTEKLRNLREVFSAKRKTLASS